MRIDMDRTGARGLPRTCARVAVIVAAFLLLVPAFGQAASVILEWDRNADGVTAGYYVYYGTESGNYSGTVDVGSSTSAVVYLNDPSATYYFAVQAYSATGEKSPLSTEVVWYQSGTPTGGAPTGGAPGGESPTLRNPGSMSTVVGQSVNLQLSASDPGGLVLSYSVTGLPPGLALGTGTGGIFGIPSAPSAYNVTITVTNTKSLSASQTFTWTILSQPSSTAPGGSVPGTGGGGSATGGGGSGTGGGGTISDAPVFGGGGGTPSGGGTPVSPSPGGGGTPSGGGTPVSPSPVPGPDLTPPSVTVYSPSSAGGSSRTTSSKVIVTGSASDNVGVVSVTWANSRGGSGSALGTSSWATNPIDLQMGDNVIAITATDAAGNVKTVTLTVTRYVDIENFVN
jgi:hypothetical protein